MLIAWRHLLHFKHASFTSHSLSSVALTSLRRPYPKMRHMTQLEAQQNGKKNPRKPTEQVVCYFTSSTSVKCKVQQAKPRSVSALKPFHRISVCPPLERYEKWTTASQPVLFALLVPCKALEPAALYGKEMK